MRPDRVASRTSAAPTSSQAFEALTQKERADFRSWAQARPQFRPDWAPGTAIGSRADQRDSIAAIGGTIVLRHQVQSVQELVEKWRSLGSPSPTARFRRGVPRAQRDGPRP